MTDEEMAEAYTKEVFGLYCPTDQERYQVEQAYLAGLNKAKEELAKAKKLLAFWVNDFYEVSSSPSKYEERHKALVESEQFLREV